MAFVGYYRVVGELPCLAYASTTSFKLITRNDFFYWIEGGDPFLLIEKAAWLPILGCRKLVECVLLYPFRWFFFFFSFPLRFARAWHSVRVSKRREGGRHLIHRRESGLI